MGKYPPSRLKDKYSDWHWRDQRFKRDALLTDIDRLWVQVRDGNPEPVAVFDLKERGAEITWTEKVVYDWIEEKGLPVYIVWTEDSFTNFKIRRWKNGATKYFDQEEYIEFINNLCESIF